MWTLHIHTWRQNVLEVQFEQKCSGIREIFLGSDKTSEITLTFEIVFQRNVSVDSHDFHG